MLTWILLPLGAYAFVCLVAWLFQAKLVYFPGPPPRTTPRALGLAYEDLPVRTSDGLALSAWYLPASAPLGAVLFAHGNAGTIEDRLVAAQALLATGFSVLLFDYRGYGASEGAPGEAGTYLDAEAAFDTLRARTGADAPIVAWGESLGGAVALELALRRPVAALVLENAFTSLPDAGARAYPWLPVRLLSRIRYDNLSKIGRLACPVLVVSSSQDEIVPFEHGRRLFEAAREPKRFLETDGAHNEGGFLRRPDWRAAVESFLREVQAR